MSGLELLKRVVPTSDREAAGDWSAVERALGLALPTDFVGLNETFGPGCWWSWLCTPAPHQFADLAGAEIAGARELQSSGAMAPVPLFPEPSGMLPWAGSLGGDSYWWDTSPHDPDSWTVVALCPTGQRRRFPLTATELLAAWITGSLGGDMLPRPAPRAQPYFDRALRRGGLVGRLDEGLSIDQCIGLLRRQLGTVHVRWHTVEPEHAAAHLHALEVDWLVTIRRRRTPGSSSRSPRTTSVEAGRSSTSWPRWPWSTPGRRQSSPA